MIDASQRMMRINSQEAELGGGINHARKRYLELEIGHFKMHLEMQWSGDIG